MNPKSKLILVVLIGILALGLFVTGYLILPDTVTMQLQADGSAGTTMPKVIALLIPLVFTGVFAALFYKNGATKHLLVSLLTFAFNH